MTRNYSVLLPQVLSKLFPDDARRQEVDAILAAYGSEDYHVEVERVRLGILKISGSDIEKVKRSVALACSDFRDLLVEAECPLSFAKDRLKEQQPERYAKLQKKEQEQYDQWLTRVLAA
jgi:hypothetical protein